MRPFTRHAHIPIFIFLFIQILCSTGCEKSYCSRQSIKSVDGPIIKNVYKDSLSRSPLKFEFIQAETSLGYLILDWGKFPACKDKTKCVVTISTQKDEKSFICTRFKGGQKLKLSDECLGYIEQKKDVVASLGRYKIHITLENS